MMEQYTLSRPGEAGPLGVARQVRPERSLEETESESEPVGAGEAPGAWSEELDVSIYAASSLTLPGMGEPGKNCGEAIPIEYCEECGEPHFATVSCDQRQCPDCWRSWQADRAEGIVRRLAAARRAAGDGLERRLLHSVVSPPEGEVRTLVDFDDMMSRAYDLMREAGARGGVAIPHGWRVTETAKEEWARATDRGESGPALWAWVRSEYGEAWREAVYWSPHVHVLALASEFGENDPESQDGWVVSRIRSLSEWSLTDREGYEDMARAASYLLSHSAYEPQSNTDSVRWFGDLHPSNFSPDPESGEMENPSLPSLSEGLYRVIERYAAEAVGLEEQQETEASECRRDECDGKRRSIHMAGEWLMDPDWCDHIGPEQVHRLETALEWLCGEIRPPPGLKNPRDQEQAREALEAML
jgi:hypothetical protein